MATQPRKRRGVLLLIVLSLLVLFLLVGMSFMMSAGQFHRLASSAAKTETTGMSGSKLADSVMYQLLRGTNNPYSSLRGHSLLEDLYGRDYLVGSVQHNDTSYAAQHGQQIQRIEFSLASVILGGAIPGQQSELQDDYYAGCVLTFTSGASKGVSTRVVEYKPQFPRPYILIKGIRAKGNPNPNALSFDQNDSFIINGRPFNGTGAGYSPVTGSLNLGVTGQYHGLPVAFLPHYRAYDNFPGQLMGVDPSIGGLDESYDSVDFQNMALSKPADRARFEMAAGALAAMTPEVFDGLPDDQKALFSFYGQAGGSIPSFHRPYLIEHVKANREAISPPITEPDLNALSSALIMRPMSNMHPAFTGSNPTFDPVYGPWDVDNDGDGIPESIWIDAGLPPVPGPDGRLYKPLVAIHITDLDGRININAADSTERLVALSGNGQSGFGSSSGCRTVLPSDLEVRPEHLGIGHGPADMRPPLIPGTALNGVREKYAGNALHPVTGEPMEITHPNATLQANGQWDATLGNDGLWSLSAGATSPPFAWDENAGAGVAKVDDDLAIVQGGYTPPVTETRPLRIPPQVFRGVNPGNSSLLTGFGSPSDLRGQSLPIIDPHGNMLWAGRSIGNRDGYDDPYELNLVFKSVHDNPYDLDDLVTLVLGERIERELKTKKNDGKQILVRKQMLTNASQVLTTHSFSIPAASVAGMGRYRGTANSGDGLPRSIRDLFLAKIRRNGGTSNVNLNQLMAPEFERGEKLDINRVLMPNRPQPIGASPSQLGQHNALQLQILKEKERFARQLFNLMMVLCDEPDVGHPNVSPAMAREAHVRRIAQWAINVVDFGDADSVMTRFRYDVNPFNAQVAVVQNQGTAVDTFNTSSPDFRMIWGMEHPEVVLSETLAIHDRRTENTDQEPGGGEFFDPADPNLDDDFDQTTKPEGSLFVELLCLSSQRPSLSGNPWLHVGTRGPEDVHAENQTGLNLAAHLPSSAKPVWRVAISEITDGMNTPRSSYENVTTDEIRSFEPSDPPVSTQDTMNSFNLRLKRFIWFSNSTPPADNGGVDGEELENTYVNKNLDYLDPIDRDVPQTVAGVGQQMLVQPGNYVVIGPRLSTRIGLDPDTLRGNDQRIDLRFCEHRNQQGQQLRQLPPNPAGPYPLRIHRVIAETANAAKAGVSISEPTAGSNYYPELPASPPAADPANPDPNPIVETYADVEDVPFDAEPPVGGDEETAPLADNDFQRTATTEDVRTVFLQRLANPGLPWNDNPNDPRYNPYRTVDWMSVDLTVFNSLNDTGEEDPDDPDANKNLDVFSSLEKSGLPPKKAQARFEPGLFNIWSGWSRETNRIPSVDSDLRRAGDTDIAHSLGWLNRRFEIVGGAAGPTGYSQYRKAGNYVEAPELVADFANQMQYTFPTLVWHNRPYANPYELMLVPATSSSRLSTDFSVSQSTSPVAPPDASQLGTAYRGAFGHLLNFFQSSAGTKNETIVGGAGNFYRIFDFVDVPSKFAGTQSWLNQSQIHTSSKFHIDTTALPESLGWVDRNTKKSAISEMREPGKLNPNTFHPEFSPNAALDRLHERVGFNSELVKRDEGGYDAWLLFQNSLAGNAPVVTDTSIGSALNGRIPNGLYPAEYPNPLRAGSSADLVPKMGPTPVSTGVQGTLLRANQWLPAGTPLVNGQTAPAGQATLSQPALAPYNIFPPNHSNTPQQLLARTLQNRRSNAYFRYKDLMKLGNSVTSQSNVYACWITVGYFEVLPNVDASGNAFAIDTSHPDGYRFGMELGSDIGKVTRHQSFYIIDRSIPVGFQPGVNHNVDKAVLVRREGLDWVNNRKN